MESIQTRKTTKIGVVVSNKAKKTVTVLVERPIRQQINKKIIKKRKKFQAHDEYEKCQVGEMDRIIETRPLSKRKRWRIQEIVGLSPSETEKEIEERKE